MNELINASLNWASIAGLFLILIWIPAIASGIFRIWFTLNRKADNTPRVILQTFLIFFLTIGRAFCIPLAGGILFFQGWRLDPILQFSQSLLVIGIVVEMVTSFINDYRNWRSRVRKTSANIPLKKLASDK